MLRNVLVVNEKLIIGKGILSMIKLKKVFVVRNKISFEFLKNGKNSLFIVV